MHLDIVAGNFSFKNLKPGLLKLGKKLNMLELNKIHVPNYFDDQRFGCLRHGQGFIVRQLMSGNFEKALLAMLAAPSKYGSETQSSKL